MKTCLSVFSLRNINGLKNKFLRRDMRVPFREKARWNRRKGRVRRAGTVDVAAVSIAVIENYCVRILNTHVFNSGGVY